MLVYLPGNDMKEKKSIWLAEQSASGARRVMKQRLFLDGLPFQSSWQIRKWGFQANTDSWHLQAELKHNKNN